MKKLNIIFKYLADFFVKTFTVKHLKNKYGQQFSNEVAQSLTLINIKRIIPLSVIIGIFQVVFLLMYNLNGVYDSIGDIRYISSASQIFLLICSILFGLTAVGYIRKIEHNAYDYLEMKRFCRLFYFFISVGMMFYIYSDLKAGKISNTLYYMAIIYATIPVFTMRESIFFILFNTLSVVCALFLVGSNSFLQNIQVIFIFLSSWGVSFHLRATTYNTLYHEYELNYVNDKLEQLSKIDPLTGLPNRRFLDEYVNNKLLKWKNNKMKVMVLMVDIDNFKNYNDTYSHLDGDDCLNAVAKSISRTLSEIDGIKSIITRIGGEEFLILIENWNTWDTARDICSRIRSSVEKMHLIAGSGSMHKYVTISMGCSIFDAKHDDINSFEAQYRLADYELYKAKNEGKNRISIEGEITV